MPGLCPHRPALAPALTTSTSRVAENNSARQTRMPRTLLRLCVCSGELLATVLGFLDGSERVTVRCVCRALSAVPRASSTVRLSIPKTDSPAWPAWVTAEEPLCRPDVLEITGGACRMLELVHHAGTRFAPRCVHIVAPRSDTVHDGGRTAWLVGASTVAALCMPGATVFLGGRSADVLEAPDPELVRARPPVPNVRLWYLDLVRGNAWASIAAWRPRCLRIALQDIAQPLVLDALRWYKEDGQEPLVLDVRVDAAGRDGTIGRDGGKGLASALAGCAVLRTVDWFGPNDHPVLACLLDAPLAAERLILHDGLGRGCVPAPGLRLLAVHGTPSDEWVGTHAPGLQELRVQGECCCRDGTGRLGRVLAAAPGLRRLRVCFCMAALNTLLEAAQQRRRRLVVEFSTFRMACARGADRLVWEEHVRTVCAHPSLHVPWLPCLYEHDDSWP